MKIIIFLTFLISILNAKAFEFNVNHGDHCFLGLRDPLNPSTVLPLQKFTFSNKEFEKRNLQVRVALNSDKKDVVTKIWIDGFEKYDITNRYDVSAYGRNYPFGDNFVLGGVRLLRAGDCLVITQTFTSREAGKEYELITIVSKDREQLVKQVKISEGFVNWSWVFKDPTEYLNSFKDHFNGEENRASGPLKN